MGVEIKELPAIFTEWIADMRRVMPELARVKNLNDPIIKANARVIEHNRMCLEAAERLAPGTQVQKMRPLHRVADWCQHLIDRQQAVVDGLSDKAPAQWRDDVLSLPDHVRNPAARIIWWDWFSHQKVAQRWPQLDEFVNTTDCACSQIELITALHSCGYSPWDAYRRIAHL